MSDMDYSHCLHLSYAYEIPENKTIIDGLKEVCTAECYTFQCDADAVRSADSFQSFMNKMGQADQIVMVVSDKYFKSYFCMYELIEIIRKGGLAGRVIPVWLKDMDCKPQSGEFQQKVINDWKVTQTDGEASGPSADEVNQLLEYLPDALKELGGLRALTFDADFSQADSAAFFSQLRKRILYPIPRTDATTVITRKGDEQFRASIVDKVQGILDASPLLMTELEKVSSKSSGAAETATYLCDASEQNVCVVLEDELFPAIRAVDSQQRNAGFIENMKELASTLVLLAVNGDWLRSWENEITLGNLRMNFELSAASALIVTSRLHQKSPKFGYKQGNAGLWGCDQLELPAKQGSWRSRETVDNILLKIWREVFPETAKDKLDEKAIKTLNSRLRRYYRNDIKQHYICSETNENSYLLDSNVLHGLQKYLPALLILVLEDSQGNTTVAIQNDAELVDALRDFLTDLDKI